MHRPTIPNTTTVSPTRAPELRRALKVVQPAHMSGAASLSMTICMQSWAYLVASRTQVQGEAYYSIPSRTWPL
jgi:hypothetical protein